MWKRGINMLKGDVLSLSVGAEKRPMITSETRAARPLGASHESV